MIINTIDIRLLQPSLEYVLRANSRKCEKVISTAKCDTIIVHRVDKLHSQVI